MKFSVICCVLRLNDTNIMLLLWLLIIAVIVVSTE